MARKQNLMAAALVTAALGSAWFFADAGRAPFSRKGMVDPYEAARQEAEAAMPTPEEELAAVQAVLAYRAESLQRRTERADAVQGWFSALRYMRAEGADESSVRFGRCLLRYFGSDSEAAEALRAGVRAQEELTRQYFLALVAARARVLAEDGYGSAWVRNFYETKVPFLIETVEEEQELCREPERSIHISAEEMTDEAPQPECRFAELAERLDWALRTMRQRTKLAAAVKNYATAKTYMNFNRPEVGGKALNLMKEARAALAPQEEHDCDSVQTLRARQQEITDVWEAFQQVEADMRARAKAADYYGVPELAELP